MFKIISYLLKHGVATSRKLFPPLEEGVRGLPKLTDKPCSSPQCNLCVELCPTQAITIASTHQATTAKAQESAPIVSLDLGACISCGLCIQACPTETIVNDPKTQTAQIARGDLILSSLKPEKNPPQSNSQTMFSRSLAIRVVSTGCSACDLEIGAAGNPIFDMERFGVNIVASPRFADALLITGPAPKAMHDPLKRCYEAMAEPRLVIAAGTCAITGGMHKDGYAQANGVDSVLPVDIYIPGCPPHPWSIIDGVRQAMHLVPGRGTTAMPEET